MSIKKSLSAVKTMGPAIVALVLLSPFANADTYTLTGGLTNVHSTTFNVDVGIDPNPSGIAEGSVEVTLDTSTGAISIAPGTHIVLSDFDGTIMFLGTTTFDAIATDITTNVGASGTLDANRHVFMSSATASPAVEVLTNFQNCSGIACGFLGLVDLNLVSYAVDVTYNASFTQFTGTLSGATSNGSTVEMAITGSLQSF